MKLMHPAQDPGECYHLPPDSPANLSLRILLVEDHPAVGELTRKILAAGGHQVRWVVNVAEAALEAGQKEFDLLVCDFALPDGDGIEVLKRVKAFQPGIKSILVTSHAADLARTALAAGFGLFMQKPVAVDELLKAIAACGNQI
jgi:two-component system OmpR family response regulator